MAPLTPAGEAGGTAQASTRRRDSGVTSRCSTSKQRGAWSTGTRAGNNGARALAASRVLLRRQDAPSECPVEVGSSNSSSISAFDRRKSTAPLAASAGLERRPHRWCCASPLRPCPWVRTTVRFFSASTTTGMPPTVCAVLGSGDGSILLMELGERHQCSSLLHRPRRDSAMQLDRPTLAVTSATW
jgi:hypothetical protein